MYGVVRDRTSAAVLQQQCMVYQQTVWLGHVLLMPSDAVQCFKIWHKSVSGFSWSLFVEFSPFFVVAHVLYVVGGIAML